MLARAIIALAVTYGAFLAEVFRAGIQSIGRGQMEAARSLGMGYGQAMRFIILPQAIRNVLPALGNDFVSMVKDSSLVSVLAVRDMTQIARLYAGSTFRFRGGLRHAVGALPDDDRHPLPGRCDVGKTAAQA